MLNHNWVFGTFNRCQWNRRIEYKSTSYQWTPHANYTEWFEEIPVLINYYHKFVTKIAEITVPLKEISGSQKKTNKRSTTTKRNTGQAVFWENKMCTRGGRNFRLQKSRQIPYTLFRRFDTHVRAVLEKEEGKMFPFAFFSKFLPRISRVRSVFYKELRALSKKTLSWTNIG